ncbi:MAG: hypothetical protein C0594_09295, partial [Marinilabiliales bacterium]
CTKSATVNFPFLKPFYVLEEYDNSVKVVAAGKVNSLSWSLDPGYQDSVFFMKKDDLLLWSNPVLSDSLLIDRCNVKLPQKAMIIKNLRNLESQDIYVNPAGIREGNYISSYSPREVEVLYLYQYDEESDAFLCGADSRIPSIRHVSSSIRGWVSASSLAMWYSTLCIEPNWITWSQRSGSDEFARGYSRLYDARQFSSNKYHIPSNSEGLIFNEENYRATIEEDPLHRLPGDMLRFQLLTRSIDLTNDFPRVGFVGEKIDNNSNCTFSPAELATYRRDVADVISGRQRNNIIFVIDGTQSMDMAVEGVTNALTRTMELIQNENEAEIAAGGSPIEYFFGAVVYRDTDDNNPIELTYNGELTQNRARVVSDLRRIFSHPATTPTECEGVFLGIQTAVEQFNPNPCNRNYLILLGDAGNNYDHVNFGTDEVAGWLSERNINFFSIQVRHKVSACYDNFCQESSDILSNNIMSISNAFKEKYNREYRNGDECIKSSLEYFLGDIYNAIPKSRNDITTVSNNTSVTGTNYIDENIEIIPYNVFNGSLSMGAKVCIPGSGSENDIIHEQELSTLLDFFLRNINKYNKSFGREYRSADDYIKRVMADLFPCLPMKKLAAVFGEGAQLYQEGYTAYNPNWLSTDEPLWQYVSFVNHSSAGELLANINSLFSPNFSSVNQLRNQIFTVLRSLIVNRYRYLSPEEFNDTEICNVLSLLTGLPADRSNFDWCSVVMKDINNPKRVPDEAVLEMALNFIIFKGHLESIQNKRAIFDVNFFNTYQNYVLRYLQKKGIIVPPPQRLPYYRRLAEFFSDEYQNYYQNPTFKY